MQQALGALFHPAEPNFFVTDLAVANGLDAIDCRFGTRGILAAAHYDAQRNFVAVLRGAKRYVLLPPRECSRLGLVKDRAHPSHRHATADWSRGAEHTPRGARGLDAVLVEGELLYLPPFWFHYIAGLRANVQCNKRSLRFSERAARQLIESCMAAGAVAAGAMAAGVGGAGTSATAGSARRRRQQRRRRRRRRRRQRLL